METNTKTFEIDFPDFLIVDEKGYSIKTKCGTYELDKKSILTLKLLNPYKYLILYPLVFDTNDENFISSCF